MGENAVAIKLPPLWTSDVEAWFVQAEAQFGIRKITDEKTKYWYVIAALDSRTASRASSVIKNPPADNPYQALKECLIRTFQLTDYQRADALLRVQLGDRTPSDVVDEMLRLNGDHQTCYFLRYLFLRLLPAYARSALMNSATQDLRQLAVEADNIVLSNSASPPVAMVSPNDDAHDTDVNRVSAKQSFRSGPGKAGLCFFHQRFGSRARKCVPPCTWNSSQNHGQPGNAFQGPQRQ